MANIILIFKLVTTLFPLIDSIIKTIELALPQGGKGAEKLALARSFLNHAFESMHEIEVTFEQAWPALNAVITGLVALYNAAGIFKKTT